MNAFNILLWTHIVSGSIGLLSGTVNIIRKKGDKQHRLIGKLFVLSMIASSASAMMIAVMHPNRFLFVIGLFTLYLCITGQRSLSMKNSNAKKLDWLISISMAILAIGMTGFGFFKFFQGLSFGLVLAVFGFFSLMMVYTDYKNYTGKSAEKNYWLTTHLQRTIGAYIAATTAFLVVNNKIIPGIIAWLLPTAIFVPLIVFWTAKHKQK